MFFTKDQLERLAQAAKRDGLKSAHLARIFINQGLARYERRAA
jgi:hypothetical protein